MLIQNTDLVLPAYLVSQIHIKYEAGITVITLPINKEKVLECRIKKRLDLSPAEFIEQIYNPTVIMFASKYTEYIIKIVDCYRNNIKLSLQELNTLFMFLLDYMRMHNTFVKTGKEVVGQSLQGFASLILETIRFRENYKKEHGVDW